MGAKKAGNRFLAVLLAAALICGLFAGCSAADNRRTYEGDGWYAKQTDPAEPEGSTPAEDSTPSDDPSLPPETEATTPTEARQELAYSVLGTVATDHLILRDGPGAKYSARLVLPRDTRLVIYTRVYDNGAYWGRTDLGWVCMDYVRVDDESGYVKSSSGTIPGTITASQLNVRTGPGLEYETLKSLPHGTRVEVQRVVGNWGRIQDGWVNLDHVYLDKTPGMDGIYNAKVDATDVNIRSGPGTKYAILMNVDTGYPLVIYHIITLNNRTWGCSNRGWICMDYVKLESTPRDFDTAVG